MLTACRASQRLGRRRGTHPSPCPTTALTTNIVGPSAEEAPIGLSLKVISSFPDCEVYNMIRYCQMSRTHNVRCRVGPACAAARHYATRISFRAESLRPRRLGISYWLTQGRSRFVIT